VFVSDHGASGRDIPRDDPSEQFHVPLLIIAPGLPPRRDDTLGGQTDLFPTIMDLAGWSGTHATLGRSLLERSDPDRRFALCVVGQMPMLVEPGGWLVHDLKAVRAQAPGCAGDVVAGMERRLLGCVQTLTLALRENRVYREPTFVPHAHP
jgi:hypothetical protein